MKKYLKTFNEKCIGCNNCMSVCAKLYFKEDNPDKSCIRVAAAGADAYELTVCNQCRRCVQECPTLALTVNKLGVVMLNKALCINCMACAGACPTGVMRAHAGGLTPFKCIACGACARECPSGALAVVNEEEKP
jgi:anaerobic carbon-monoxide dehydrogenase iron sulfur subunit